MTRLVGSQGSVPPVMAFHLGSLGFLTPFNFENFQTQVTQVIQGEWPCSGATTALGTRVSSLGLGSGIVHASLFQHQRSAFSPVQAFFPDAGKWGQVAG